jgi:hypothetical protein
MESGFRKRFKQKIGFDPIQSNQIKVSRAMNLGLHRVRRIGLVWNAKTPETLPYRPNLILLGKCK